MPLNIEIKARTEKISKIRDFLRANHAEEKGTDYQTDTYFKCDNGRLKLRQGNVENSLIFYKRSNQAGPKASEVNLYYPRKEASEDLKELLSAAYGKWKEVKKAREIFYIENVKFHLDTVDRLGQFVEIEAIDRDGSISEAQLLKQCKRYMALFEIEEGDLLETSYSDMV